MTAPALTTYRCGIDGYSRIHALGDGHYLSALCGALCREATRWGAFHVGLPAALKTTQRLCGECAWTAALTNDTQAAELAHWVSNGDSGPAGDLARRAATVLLDGIVAAGSLEDTSMALRILAAVSTHWPVSLLPEDCVEQECDHDNADECDTLAGSVACPTCSVRTGPEAGEWEGQYEVPVPAPCSALASIAQYLGVDLEVPA